MSGSLNQMPKYRANLPNEGHDLGMVYQFTSAPGMILPIYHHILNQGEKVAFNCNINTNVAIPLVKPAQLKVREKVDVFFVPMQMMLTTFGQSFYGGNDYLSSLLLEDGYQSTLNVLPLFDILENSAILFPDLESLNRSGFLDESPSNVPFLDSRGFDTMAKGAFRLLMHLDYNPEAIFTKIRTDLQLNVPEILAIQPNVFPASLLAYHAIYENYYRNDDREKRRLKSYQFDYGHSYSGDPLPLSDVKSLFSLHYHSRIKDYFTSLKVSPILSALNIGDSFDDASGADGDLMSHVLNFLGDADARPANSNETDIPYDSSMPFLNKQITQFTQDFAAGSMKVSTAGIRSLFAVEKLNRIMGRAKKDYDSQTLAHLGFKVPRDVKHEITYLGGYEGGIGVRQHYSQANTYNSNTGDGAELGEQFGTAEGGVQGDHVIKFTAPCHGVFMAVHFIIPEVTYPQGVCLDKSNMLTDRLSFFIPEFDKLGMQPLFAYEAANRVIPYYESNQFNYYYIPTNVVLGWQYRYEQYKRKYNRHSIAFLRPRVPDSNGNIPVNSWSPWIVGAEPYDFFKFSVASGAQTTITDAFPACFTFWVSPTYLDNLFVNGYNTHVGLVPDYAYTSGEHEYTEEERKSVIDYIEHPWLLFQTDMFMHQASFSCKLISKMSKYGEPELI